MANFPTSIISFTDPSSANFLNNPAHSTQHANENDEIVSIETKVGTGASTPVVSTVLTGTGVGTSAWQAPTAQTVALLATQTASNSATLDFTSLTATGYSAWKVIITDLIPASASDLWIRISTGSAFKSGGTDYRYRNDIYGDDTGHAQAQSTGAAQILLDNIGLYNTGVAPFSAEITIYNPGGTVNNKMLNFHSTFLTGTGVFVWCEGAGFYTGAVTALDGPRFLMATGNITAGTIKVYGITT